MPIPIPPRPSGYRLGAADAAIQIDAFIDLQCEYSRRCWPVLRQLGADLGRDSAAITAHLTVISHHRQVWDVSCAAVAVAGDDPERFWRFATFLYERQDSYLNGAMSERTPTDLRRMLAGYAAEFSGQGEPEVFVRRMVSDPVFAATKVPIRYGISRGVWSTPTFFINGAEASQLSSASTVADWRAILEPQLSAIRAS
ncbi:MAG: thioredoxin domain-containing protein [Myxococcota bacterium]